MEAILGIIIAALLSENFILVKFYGICPFMGVSKKIDTALGMGMAVTFVMAIASAACWAVDCFILQPLGLAYMQTVAFILVIASIVQVVEMFLKKSVPALYSALGIFLPLITTNCAVLGVALVNVQEGYDFLTSVLNGGEGFRIIEEGYPAMQMVMPVGGFLTLGFVIAFFQWFNKKRELKKRKEAVK